MILTCPECSTKYVVKDGAIPAGGRQVRCAACKASWHQDPEPAEALESGTGAEMPLSTADAPGAVPVGDPDASVITQPEPAVAADHDTMGDEGQWQTVETGPQWTETDQSVDDRVEFEPHFHDEPLDEPRRGWKLVLVALLLAALAAIAFWFLAPAGLKARVGLAQGETELQVMGLSQARQRLASGNDLFTVSGRIVNPTGESQRVPPLEAELLAENKQTVIYRWTIAPPAETIDANDSTVFHSAEMGVPDGGKYLRLRLASAGG